MYFKAVSFEYTSIIYDIKKDRFVQLVDSKEFSKFCDASPFCMFSDYKHLKQSISKLLQQTVHGINLLLNKIRYFIWHIIITCDILYIDTILYLLAITGTALLVFKSDWVKYEVTGGIQEQFVINEFRYIQIRENNHNLPKISVPMLSKFSIDDSKLCLLI
ncbi:hypothetical protein BpHYR1_002622 [Brachionus plicatilis]|uniref:Uncharacterized protein n=1 Tax=Brachionus plicatilis TaxID=10195 RepID=A0A3M7SEE3_BRAPC|nr:hypothetical protein BpHYR1_002622 [Brachionus plicatilis]